MQGEATDGKRVLQQKRGDKSLLCHYFIFLIKSTIICANNDKKTSAPYMIKPTLRALSDAKKINTVEATHTTGIDIKKAENGILRLSLNIEAGVNTIKNMRAVHTNPQKAAYQNGIIRPPTLSRKRKLIY